MKFPTGIESWPRRDGLSKAFLAARKAEQKRLTSAGHVKVPCQGRFENGDWKRLVRVLSNWQFVNCNNVLLSARGVRPGRRQRRSVKRSVKGIPAEVISGRSCLIAGQRRRPLD